jgi:hypothetical protein
MKQTILVFFSTVLPQYPEVLCVNDSPLTLGWYQSPLFDKINSKKSWILLFRIWVVS